MNEDWSTQLIHTCAAKTPVSGGTSPEAVPEILHDPGPHWVGGVIPAMISSSSIILFSCDILVSSLSFISSSRAILRSNLVSTVQVKAFSFFKIREQQHLRLET